MVNLETRKTLGATVRLPVLLMMMVAITLVLQPIQASGSIYTQTLQGLGNSCELEHCKGIKHYITTVRPLAEADCLNASSLEAKHELAEKLSFELVSPGPLPFEEGSFDVVTSKDSILHIADKYALATDVFRVLKPGGVFAASDWLAGYEHEPSPEMKAYVDAEDLGFGMASAVTYRQAMDKAGFEDVDFVDRNEWYRGVARAERERLTGDLYTQLTSAVGREFLDRQIEVWNLMIVALDQGQLRPTLLRGKKPVH